MSLPALVLRDLALREGGSALTTEIGRGQLVAVAGPPAAGKSLFLRVLAGEARAGGEVGRAGTVALAPAGALPARAKVASLVKGLDAARQNDLLLLTGLWPSRAEAIGTLTPAREAAAELLPALADGADVLLLDGQLDRMDPWTQSRIGGYLADRRREGLAVVAATHRPDLVGRSDLVLVFQDRQTRFAGTVEELLRRGPAHGVTVESRTAGAVRAITEPFEVRWEETSEGVRLTAREGQELAARLLRDGYGDVRWVLHRPPTVEEALLAVLG